jgi:hypothetical protein
VAATTRNAKPPFASLLALGLASLEPGDLVPSTLSLEFGVSAWLRRSGADFADARRSALALRRAILAVSVLDEATEPIPLIGRDQNLALRSLSLYLHGLLVRAAASMETTREEIAEAALSAIAAEGGLERRRTS